MRQHDGGFTNSVNIKSNASCLSIPRDNRSTKSMLISGSWQTSKLWFDVLQLYFEQDRNNASLQLVVDLLYIYKPWDSMVYIWDRCPIIYLLMVPQLSIANVEYNLVILYISYSHSMQYFPLMFLLIDLSCGQKACVKTCMPLCM